MALFDMKNKSKRYSNPLMNFAHNWPLVGLIVIPVLLDWPAKAFQAGVRTAKYGDPRLGSTPIEPDMKPGVGDLSLFGSVVKQGGEPDEGNTFPARGDMYRDTSHLNSAKTGPMYGDSFYRDTRHLTPSRPTPQARSEGGWLDKPGTQNRVDPRPSYGRRADPALVNLVQEGTVFRGINGIGRLRR